MDRHKYVKVAYHGFREMSKEEKVAAYGSTLIRDSFDEPDYALIDTLFSLGEAYLFAQLVDFMDSNPGKVPSGTEYDHSDRCMFMIPNALIFSHVINMTGVRQTCLHIGKHIYYINRFILPPFKFIRLRLEISGTKTKSACFGYVLYFHLGQIWNGIGGHALIALNSDLEPECT
jgi:hypothetical protein